MQTKQHIDRVRYIWNRELAAYPKWLDLFADMANFSFHTFEGLSYRPHSTMVLSDFGAWASNTIHQFLSWRPLSCTSPRSAIIQEACRLGALIYLVPVWRFFGVAPVVSGYLISKLKLFLELNHVEWGALWAVQAWILYMAALEAPGCQEEAWFYDQLACVLEFNGVTNWDDAMTYMKNILRFDCLFGGKDETLRTEVMAILEADRDTET